MVNRTGEDGDRWGHDHRQFTAGTASTCRVRTDGGVDRDEEDDETADERQTGESNIDVAEEGDAEPVDPEWRKPDIDDIPEFEIRANDPAPTEIGPSGAGGRDGPVDEIGGMPNTARSPGKTRISSDGTEGYIAALELCVRLPDDIRLPAEAADLVPAAVEAELEADIAAFAASEFDSRNPTVQALTFEEVSGAIWMRLRLGAPAAAIDEIDPEGVRAHALKRLEGIF